MFNISNAIGFVNVVAVPLFLITTALVPVVVFRVEKPATPAISSCVTTLNAVLFKSATLSGRGEIKTCFTVLALCATLTPRKLLAQKALLPPPEGVCQVAKPEASEVNTFPGPGEPPVIFIWPFMSNLVVGLSVPMPILPLPSMVILSLPP